MGKTEEPDVILPVPWGINAFEYKNSKEVRLGFTVTPKRKGVPFDMKFHGTLLLDNCRLVVTDGLRGGLRLKNAGEAGEVAEKIKRFAATRDLLEREWTDKPTEATDVLEGTHNSHSNQHHRIKVPAELTVTKVDGGYLVGYRVVGVDWVRSCSRLYRTYDPAMPTEVVAISHEDAAETRRELAVMAKDKARYDFAKARGMKFADL